MVTVNLERMHEPQVIIGLIKDNLEKTMNPLAIPNEEANYWWKSVSVPSTGEYMLYTGMLYQLVPYIEYMTMQLEKMETSGMRRFMKMAKKIPKRLLKSLYGKPASKEMRDRFNNIVASIAKLLSKAGVNYYYKPDIDYYTGILLYDLGDEEGFQEYARRLAKILRENGVEKIITIDPHTTYAFEKLYPEYADFEVEVKTYIEALLESNAELKCRFSEKVTIHDPCLYGRHLRVSGKSRELLSKAMASVIEVTNNLELTRCCGGPLESLYPSYAKEIARRRVEELKKTGASKIVAMCPICLANLARGGAEPIDLAELLE